MNKKILVMIVFALALFGGGSLRKVNAEAIVFDTTTWTTQYVDEWAIRYDGVIPAGVEYITFDVPADTRIIEQSGLSYSLVQFSIGATDYIYHFADFAPETFYGSHEWYVGNVDGDDLTGWDAIVIILLTTDDNFAGGGPTAGFIDDNFITPPALLANPDKALFFANIALYATDYYAIAPTEPAVDPTPNEGYHFRGWRTSTGETYDFADQPILAEWLDSNGDFRLFAVFTLFDESGYIIEEPTDNAPTEFGVILGAFGLNNSDAKIFLFCIGALILTCLLLAFKASVFVFIIAYTAETALFMFLGWLPLFASVIVFMLIALGTIFAFKTSGGQAYE